MKARKIVLLYALSMPFFVSSLFADEGMWLLNDFPAKKVKEKYGFSVTKEWLDHAKLSSIRLANGCSGSFVSKEGLILTNHHCVDSCIEQLSTSEKDFIASGFYAKSLPDEVKCPEIEVNQLIDITDVTSLINKATKGLEAQKFNEVQKAEMSRIENECSGKKEDIRCDVVTLYFGGKYHLYKYQRYQDVRLVFAPEIAIANFGGDPDNFMFPRYDLDMALLRAYDKDAPLKTGQFFKWSSSGAVPGELTFVSGHPGRSERLLTIPELEFQRDVYLPYRIFYLSEFRGLITEFQTRGAEQKRFSMATLLEIENSLKAFKGRLEALQDKTFFTEKVADENLLRRKINSNPVLKRQYGNAWAEIAKAEASYKDILKDYQFIERDRGFSSTLYSHAKTLVRAVTELTKPNDKRFREYIDANMPVVKQELFSTAPIYDEFEELTLTFSLTKLREALGVDSPFIKKLFGSKAPEEIAKALIQGTKLKDVKFREALFAGGPEALQKSDDPMLQFAREVDVTAREIRRTYEDTIEASLKKNGELVAKAFFAINGTDTYPDATSTLRLTYGKVVGYVEKGDVVKPITVFRGMFDRHTGRDPFALPESWLKAKSTLDLNTPMNFCTTNDIIGGNSGSPVFDKNAEIIGLIFDGNIQSLGGDYGFDESVNRAVAVHSAAILTGLKKIYNAERIVTELMQK